MSSAGRICQVRGDHIAGRTIGAVPGRVVPPGGARVGVPHCALQVAEGPAFWNMQGQFHGWQLPPRCDSTGQLTS